jgi:hypothetical protein
MMTANSSIYPRLMMMMGVGRVDASLSLTNTFFLAFPFILPLVVIIFIMSLGFWDDLILLSSIIIRVTNDYSLLHMEP